MHPVSPNSLHADPPLADAHVHEVDLVQLSSRLHALGATSRAQATPTMLDHLAATSWNAGEPIALHPPTGGAALARRHLAAAPNRLHIAPWFGGGSRGLAAACALVATGLVAVVAMRVTSSSPVPHTQLASSSTDADLALLDALWNDSITSDLWSAAGTIESSVADVTLDDLLLEETM